MIDLTLRWQARTPGVSPTFPAWFWAKGSLVYLRTNTAPEVWSHWMPSLGIQGAFTPLPPDHAAEPTNRDGLWTYWMPWIGDDIPNPPGNEDFEITYPMPPHRTEVKATIYSPLRIEILLHCAVSPWQNPVPNFEAPGVQEEVQDLLTAGAIQQKDTRCFEATPLGRAWVDALCNVPIPRVAYLDDHGRELAIR